MGKSSELARGGVIACFALAAAAFVLAFTEPNFRAVVWAALGCGFVGAARVIQAEGHQKDQGRSDGGT